ncbi:MAG TPA: hypothetical protein DDY21_01975 [Candidatus Moranbacteria bacterium]|nr:hypothetical protein [Candidatus Moranbacteria bacterium]
MSSFLERDDPRYGEITETLLKLQQIMNKGGLYEPLVRRNIQTQLDRILMRASLFSYLKENWAYPIFAHPGCYEVLEIICGINRSVGYSAMYPETIKAYKELEQLRDRCHWRRIVFHYLTAEEFISEKKDESFLKADDTTFVVVASTDTKVFNESVLLDDLRFFDQFFRLDHNDSEKLIIDYLYNACRTFDP